MSLTDEVRAAIAAELAAGASQGSMRKKYRVGASTVQSIKASLDSGQTGLSDRTGPKVSPAEIASEHKARITNDRLVAACEAIIDRALELLPHYTRPIDIQRLATSVAIAIDKILKVNGLEATGLLDIPSDDPAADDDPAAAFRGRVLRLVGRTDPGEADLGALSG